MKPRPPVGPMVKAPRGELHSWGVDYLRVTSKTDEGKKAILMTWAKARAQQERLGDVLKNGGMQGFKGHSAGPVFYGRKEDVFMLQVSGSKADELFPGLAWEHLNCTRIDLQVTIQLPEDEPLLAARIGEARARAHGYPDRLPDPVQDLKHSYGRGDTLAIGSRSSPRYGRIYNKALESGDERYVRCWRYECEFKDMMARNIVADLRQQESLDRGVAGLLRGQFADWGIDIDLPVAGRRLAGSIGRREFDSERALKWLSSQVAPSVEKLLATVDRETVLEALGLALASESTLPTITQEWLAETRQKASDEMKWFEGRQALARR